MRGKKHSENQRAGELLMEPTTLTEVKQSSTPAKAPSPCQLQAAFPSPFPSLQGEREFTTEVSCIPQAR